MFDLRPARPDDAAVMMAIRLSVAENGATEADMTARGITIASVAAMLDGSHAAYCAVDGDQVVGFTIGDPGDGTVFALFIRPGYQGLGLGSRLLDAVVHDLRGAGHTLLTLSTGAGTRAHAFYLRRGWQPHGQTPEGDRVLCLRAD